MLLLSANALNASHSSLDVLDDGINIESFRRPLKIYFFKLTQKYFHATNPFLFPLKKSENLRFPDVFRGYRKRPLA